MPYWANVPSYISTCLSRLSKFIKCHSKRFYEMYLSLFGPWAINSHFQGYSHASGKLHISLTSSLGTLLYKPQAITQWWLTLNPGDVSIFMRLEDKWFRSICRIEPTYPTKFKTAYFTFISISNTKIAFASHSPVIFGPRSTLKSFFTSVDTFSIIHYTNRRKKNT